MKWAVIGLTAAVGLSAGCSRRDNPKQPADTAHWQIRLLVTPKQPRQLDPARLQARVTDSRNKPVAGAAVAVQIAMPTMDMGRNAVTLHEAAPGTYTGTGRFTMPGDWETTVSADRGAAHQSQTFPVSVR